MFKIVKKKKKEKKVNILTHCDSLQQCNFFPQDLMCRKDL